MKQIFQAVLAFVLVAASIDFLVTRLLTASGPGNHGDGPGTVRDTTWVQAFVTGEIERQEGLTEEHRPALVRGTILAVGRGCSADDLMQWGWTAYRDLAFTYCPAGRTPGRDNQAYIDLEDGDLYRFGLESGG